MAPKRGAAKAKAAAHTPPLTGCTVAVGGTFPGFTQGAISERIAALGATFVKSVTQECTHLIATAAELQKQSAKIKAALNNPAIHIVHLSWLDASEEDQVKAPEDDHPVAGPGAGPAAAAAAAAATAPPAANGRGSAGGGVVAAASTLVTGAAAAAASASPSAPPQQPAVANGTSKTKANGQSKRSASPDKQSAAAAAPPAKKQKTQKNKISSDPAKEIPLDDDGYQPTHKVYVAPDGTVYDASLNQTNSTANNNKFYRIQVLHSRTNSNAITWTRWGRVGDRGQSTTVGDGTLDDAIRQFDKKFKDKTGLNWADRANDPKPRKYAYLERSYEDSSDDDDDDNIKDEAAADGPGDDKGKGSDDAGTAPPPPPESKLEPATQDLLRLIFNHDFFAEAMREMNYDANKLPLGKLSKTTINRGYQALKDLSEVLDDPTLATSRHNMSLPAATEHLSNLYYTLIPHVFGRQRPPIINTNDMLKREIELLESLADMKDAEKILKIKSEKADDLHQLDKQFQGLGLEEMTPLEPTSAEFTELKEYLCGSVGATHGTRYQVRDIFRIERQGEIQRLKSEFGDEVQDRRLLWHGSRCTNFAGILSQGLRIAPPEAPASGYMFGKGIYLADMSSKSANYCSSYSSNGHALLLLCEAELGKPIQELTDADYNAGDKAKQQGMLSTWGKGTTGPQAWKDAECVNPSLKGVRMPDVSVASGPTNVPNAYLLYNEYIVYDVAQVRLRYLLRVKM